LIESGKTIQDRCDALKLKFPEHNFTESILRKFFKLHEIIYRIPKAPKKTDQDVFKAELIVTPKSEKPKSKIEQSVKIKKPARVPKISLGEFWIEKEADEVKLS